MVGLWLGRPTVQPKGRAPIWAHVETLTPVRVIGAADRMRLAGYLRGFTAELRTRGLGWHLYGTPDSLSVMDGSCIRKQDVRTGFVQPWQAARRLYRPRATPSTR